ncbi:MAG TPA: DNA polymerase III subunit gamma/tau [bacterium]|nr:DNA polymerase III subunit gamma/tau [bacterium]
MTYQVLARKYRPQTFAEVVGQEHITTTLKNALAAGRLHHAYLFVGVRGTGKTTVARILAKALCCEKKRGEEPCGECKPCMEISSSASLDVQEIDGASNTGVDDVRELRERARYMPSSGRYRIYIIDEVHMLSGNAFNALLKTLEEPPAHVVFIFATTEPHKIPATILSRCQRYDFRRISPSDISSTLSRIAGDENVDVEETALNLIAREATGSLRDAESLFDQAIAFSGQKVTADTIKSMLGFLDRKRLFDTMEAVLSRDPERALEVLSEVFATGADLSRFAADILELLRHMVVLSECGEGDKATDLVPDEISRLKGMMRGAGSKDAGAPEFHQMFSLWYRVAEEIARSQFPRMLVEVGLIRLCRVGPVRPIEEIVAKLDALSGAEARSPASFASRPAASSPPSADDPAKGRGAAKGQAKAAAAAATPTFAPVMSPTDVDAERRWQEFMRWIVGERPQVASVLQHGVLVGIDDGIVKVMFDNPLYADMLTEEARKTQAESLFATFFKRPMKLAVGRSDEAPAHGPRGEKKKEMMREALGSDIVRQAADILNAQVHDVKVDGEK